MKIRIKSYHRSLLLRAALLSLALCWDMTTGSPFLLGAIPASAQHAETGDFEEFDRPSEFEDLDESPFSANPDDSFEAEGGGDKEGGDEEDSPADAKEGEKGTETHSKKQKEEEKKKGKRYTSREELVKDANKFAIKELGFEDVDKDGIADTFQKYRINVHDCAEHSAEFDYILEKMGDAGVLDAEQAYGAGQIRGGAHAANWVPGLGEVDVTPIGTGRGYVASKGTPWYNFPRNSQFYTQGFPDAGEITAIGYNGPRANPGSAALYSGGGGLGGGGFGGGAFGGGNNQNFMNILLGLLQGKNGSGGKPAIPKPPPAVPTVSAPIQSGNSSKPKPQPAISAVTTRATLTSKGIAASSSTMSSF